ncbi:hypothetical protein LTR10_020012 [Elasticomyces elasticus]|uniref:ABM domain-containing protein n=1 Tax=Exophiala sideris TaxID=1016849 RepID=A0ABR0JNM7_9EURO|nr:hypothetical protein LTR10_020012 [Elasticomyces elasticus]KAK5037838.1 hypothetical protein LTS07_001305 [Exophiala sideris]KAK5043821.1 hypothetical protein LTR13_000175 [Exophiala sideris]KAK5067320.1 hypothetical protein LTR69_001307 [Exophiala sideris]KAK5182653.1 hypothetical protein LTR44_005044 [Eurotiomycetes sp. CCFEE 6388]
MASAGRYTLKCEEVVTALPIYFFLKNGLIATDPQLKRNLKEVKHVIEGYSKLQTLFYTQVDDPSVMFVIGAWESKEMHQHGFSGSPEQNKILSLVKDQMDIDWMHYIDVDQARLPLDARVLVIVKAVVPRETHKRIFDQDFAAGTSSLGGARYGALAAWNIPKDDNEDVVRVHFSGWDNVEEATEGIANTVEHTQRMRARPEELNFFFTERSELD